MISHNNKKRTWHRAAALLLSASLLLTACGAQNNNDNIFSPILPDNSPASSTDPDDKLPDPVTIVVEDDSVAPAEGMVRSRLTNEWVDADVAATRPIAVMRGNLATAHILEDLHHIIQHLCLDTGLAADSHGIVHHDDRQDQRDGELETAGAVFVACRSDQCTYGSGMRTGHSTAAHQTLRHEFFGNDQMDQSLQDLCHEPAAGCSQKNMITEKFFKKSHK